MIDFVSASDLTTVSGRLKYSHTDLSFDFKIDADEAVRFRSDKVGSVSIGTLQINVVVEDGTAICVWGYYPLFNSLKRRLVAPLATKCGMRLIFESRLESGISQQLAGIGEWESTFDSESGWICVGTTEISEHENVIEFADKTIAVLRGLNLVALWLSPQFT